MSQIATDNEYSYQLSPMQQEDMLSAEAFWKQVLRGFTAPTPLVVDRATGEGDNQEAGLGEEQIRLSEVATLGLKSLAQEHELRLNTLVQGAWALLLCRYSSEEDVVFAVSLAYSWEVLAGVESQVGLLSNPLPVRVGVSADLSLLPWLKQLQKQWMSQQDYEHTPLSKLLEWSDIPDGTPLCESLLVFENHQMNSANQAQGSRWENREFQIESSFPLRVCVYAGSELLVKIEYDRRRFDVATITRMLGHLQTLLAGMVANPQQRVSQLPMLTAAEQHQLLGEWNQTQAEYPFDKCIHQLFEAQVERTPEAVAVVFENQQLTYRELNAKANQLAHYLQSLGVGPEVLGGICVERSLQTMVGVLGILKAGGAYVPLDPAYPKDRLSHMLSDSQVPVLLTTERLVAGLPEQTAHVVRLDTNWGVISQMSKENPVSGVQASNLAYVIYTSGSTGKSKGVPIQHRSVLNLSTGLHQAIYAHYQDSQLRVSVNGSLSFDTSVKQIVQLLHGHTLEIVPEAIRFDGTALLSYLQRRKIDVFDCTPSQLRLLISAGLLAKLKPAPLAVLVGGEPIDESTWQALAQAENINFYNVYGPTECTVDATVCSVSIANLKPVIGHPITNTQIYILGRHLQPVPIGVPGEIYIGGDSLARGYLNRPELTMEKFIPNPFSSEPGARLYKTGDLARYLPDGNIECIGRTDHQVKIRGFRIEIGEIEALVVQHPAVQEAVVVANEYSLGDKRLVAYVVSHQKQVLTNSELRSFLKQQLPDYMVPSAFVILEALPLTPNGKVDRRALRAPEHVRQEPEETFVAPRNELEVRLTKIWEKLLGIQPIGVRDNFFELGGHSLLAVRLLNEIEKVEGKNLPLATFLKTQTVEQLALILLDKPDSAPWRSLVMIQPGTIKPPLFCIHAVWGNVLFYQKLVRYLEPDQPFYALQAQGLDGQQPPRTSVREMAAHYIREIRTVQPEGPYFLGGFSFGGLVAFEIAQQLHAQGQQIALLALLDTTAPSYSQPISGANDIESTTLLERSLFHFHKLLRLSFKDQLTYVWERLGWHLIGGKLSIFYKMYLRYIRRSFQDLRLLEVAGANHQARNSYVLQVYPGRVTLFRSSQASVGFSDDLKLGWGELAAGGVEIYEITCSHTDMMEEPQVKLLAQKLQLCLP